jgi:hypothetical protein
MTAYRTVLTFTTPNRRDYLNITPQAETGTDKNYR